MDARRVFMEIVTRRAARGTGSSRVFLAQRTMVQRVPDLSTTLSDITWTIVGGIAMRSYAPERMTLDIDVLIEGKHEAEARRCFIRDGYTILGDLSIGGFTAQHGNHVPVDVIALTTPWIEDALVHRILTSEGYTVLSRSFLLLMKLLSGRTQDLTDVQRLLMGMTPQDRQWTRETVITFYAPQFFEDYDQLCVLADLEMNG